MVDDRTTSIYRAVGKAVATRRNSYKPKLTQAQLANLSRGRLSRSAIANIESGRQRVAVHHLYDLAAALACEPGELLPPTEEIFGLSASLAVRVEGDPEASEFTRRVLRLNGTDEITRANKPRKARQ